MFKAANALFLYAETSVHLGSGCSVAAVDLAIQRERFSDLPMGAASGVKGVARDYFETRSSHADPAKEDPYILAAFGPDTDHAGEHAGALSFTDLRLLLFPIRSHQGVFAWATCPFVLYRFKRDLEMLRGALPEEKKLTNLPEPAEQKVCVSEDSQLITTSNGDRQVLLDEYLMDAHQDAAVTQLGEWLADYALPDEAAYQFWKKRLPSHLALLHDNDFCAFTQHATEVVARIKLNAQKTTTGAGGNLFYQENLPAESLLYALILAQDDLSGSEKLPDEARTATGLLDTLRNELDGERLQIGGDASTGRGLTAARCLAAKPTPASQPAEAA